MKLCRLIGGRDFVHSIEEVTVDQALEMLSTDQSLAEVIPFKNRDIIKPYFDIDDKVSPYSMKEIVLERSLSEIKKIFGCTEFAIATSNRPGYISYHIIAQMKMTVLEMNQKLKFLKTIDKTMYSFKVFRLPGQSKRLNYKPTSPPLQILQGNLRDFFISAD
jgi:hypothetical protein